MAAAGDDGTPVRPGLPPPVAATAAAAPLAPLPPSEPATLHP